MLIGNCYYRINKFREQKESYNEMIRLSNNLINGTKNIQDKIDSLCLKYVIDTYLDKNKEAIEEMDEAISLQPDCATCWYNKGSAEIKIGDNEEAETQLKIAIRYNPSYLEALINLGMALENQNKNDEAIKINNEALQVEPKSAAALNNIGVAYYNKGKKYYSNAITYYKKALENFPDSKVTLENIILIFKETNQLSEADKYTQLFNK